MQGGAGGQKARRKGKKGAEGDARICPSECGRADVWTGMENTHGIPGVVSGTSSPLQIYIRRSAAPARAGRLKVVIEAAQAEARRNIGGHGSTAIGPGRLGFKKAFLMPSAVEEAGHVVAVAAGRGKRRESGHENQCTLQHSVPARRMNGSEGAGSVAAEIALSAIAGSDNRHQVERLVVLRRFEEGHTTSVASALSHDRSPPFTLAAAPLHGRKQQRHGHKQQQKKLNPWPEHKKNPQDYQVQHLNIQQKQRPFHTQRSFQEQKRFRLPPRRQHLHHELFNLATLSVRTMLFDTIMETAEIGRHTFHRRCEERNCCSFRLLCKTTSSADGRAPGREELRKQQQGETIQYQYQDTQCVQKQDQGHCQQQLHPQPSSNSPQFHGTTRVLSRGVLDREERQRQTKAHAEQQEQRLRQCQQLSVRRPWLEVEGLGACEHQYSQGGEDGLQQQDKQQRSRPQQPQHQQTHLQYIHSQQRQAVHVYEYATCESAFPHTRAAASAVVAVALDDDRRGGRDTYVTHARNISHREEQLQLRAPAATSPLNDRASVMDIAVRSQSTSLSRFAAIENRTTSVVTAGVLRKTASGAQVVNSASVRGPADASISGCKPRVAASPAAAGHDCCSTSAVATAAACASDIATQRCDPDGLGGKGAAPCAAPRRKQLSGAQKRKRKRELMSKCRVEQASLLSFLATTVTSELILNDWYALESQLRDESAHFERLSSSAWTLPTAVAALSPISAGAAGSRRTVAAAYSQDADNLAASIAGCSGNKQHSDLRNSLHLRGNTLIDPTWSQFQKQQTDQRKQQTYQDQLVTCRKDRISREAQQHTVEAEGQEGADQFLQQTHTTVRQPSGSCSCVDDDRMAATVTGTDHASQGISSSSATSGFSNSSPDRCSNCDSLSPRCYTCRCSRNDPREVSNGTKSICGSPVVYVPPDDTCRNTTRCCGDSVRSRAESQVLLSNCSNTTCCSSSSNTSADRRASTGDSGFCTRNSCSTTDEDTSKPAENTGAAALSVVPSRRVNVSHEMEDTASAAGPQAGGHMPSNLFEEDEQHQQLQTPRSGNGQYRSSKQKGSYSATTGEESTVCSNICYVTSTAGTTERSNTDSDQCSRSVSSYHNIRSSNRKNVTEKESDGTSSAKTCNSSCRSRSGSSRSSGGSSRSSSGSSRSSNSEGNIELRVCGRSSLQQLHDGFQADSDTCAVAHSAGSCSPVDSPLTAICCEQERTEAYTGFKHYAGSDRCVGKELYRPSASEIVPSISGDSPKTATHVGGDAVSVPLRDNSPSPTANATAAAKSSTDATTYGCSMLFHLEQQQWPEDPRAVPGTGAAARLAIEDKLLDEEEVKLPVEGDRTAKGDSEEEERSVGAAQSAAKRYPNTVVEPVEAKGISFTTHSYDDVRATTACPTKSRSSSVSNGTVTMPRRRSSLSSNTTSGFISRQRSSTPTSSSTQSRWSPSRQLSSNDPEPAAGLWGAGKRNNILAAADDEASTASSSPGPVLQQLAAPLLWLLPDCDYKTSRSLSPFSSVFDPEATEASMPARIDSRRLAGDSQEQQLQQSQCEQFSPPEEQPTKQQHLQLHSKQQTLLPRIPAQPHQPQESVPLVEQQQEIAQDVPLPSRQGEHGKLSSSEPPVCVQASRGARSSTVLQQQQQHHASAAEAEDPLCDPGLWPTQISVALRISLVKRGPVQIVDFDFPRDSTQRRFGRQHYWRTAATGERFWRSWLVYSKSRDAVYCFCCKLYSQLAKSVVSTGFRRWKGAAEVLRSHEQSKDHRTCMLQWKCMCMKVGAEVAFGDLMQLWLPCGSAAASAVPPGTSGNAAAAATGAGLAVSSSASLAGGDVEAVAEDRKETKAHAPLSITEFAPSEQEVRGHHVPEDQTKTRKGKET